MTFAGILLAVFLHGPFLATCTTACFTSFGYALYTFLNKRWLVDAVYNEWIARPLLWAGYNCTFKAVDKGALEHIGPTGIILYTRRLVPQLRTMQSGKLYHYAFTIVVGLTLVVLCVTTGVLSPMSPLYDPRWLFLFLVCGLQVL